MMAAKGHVTNVTLRHIELYLRYSHYTCSIHGTVCVVGMLLCNGKYKKRILILYAVKIVPTNIKTVAQLKIEITINIVIPLVTMFCLYCTYFSLHFTLHEPYTLQNTLHGNL